MGSYTIARYPFRQETGAILLSFSWGMMLLLIVMSSCAETAPPRKAQVFGPCVGMDCLHGILMHGDAKTGDTHAVEDADKHRDDLERQAANNGKPSQMNQEEYMHGVLMHGDSKAGDSHSHEKAPTVENKAEPRGPMDQEQLMHAMLMHGDSDPAHKHRHEKADKETLKSASPPGGVPGVESRPQGAAADGDEGLLERWWRALKLLVTGEKSATTAELPEKVADYNTLHDLAAVGNTKSVSEIEKAAGHSHRDTERVHRERDRREHVGKVHIEH